MHRSGGRKRYDIRSILNGLKWNEHASLGNVVVTYISRGEPGGEGSMNGSEITGIGASAIETRTGSIPYHRVLRISIGKETVFSRPMSSAHCSSDRSA